MEVRDFADWPNIAAMALGPGEHRALDGDWSRHGSDHPRPETTSRSRSASATGAESRPMQDRGRARKTGVRPATCGSDPDSLHAESGRLGPAERALAGGGDREQARVVELGAPRA